MTEVCSTTTEATSPNQGITTNAEPVAARAPACPTGCERADTPLTHELEFADDGRVYVRHEVDFGKYVFSNVHEYVTDGAREATVTVSDDGLHTNDPAALASMAASILAAAEWLGTQR